MTITKTKTDFNKYDIHGNQYQDINKLLEDDTTLILISPNEEVQALSLIIGTSVYDTKTVTTLEQAHNLNSKRYKIIVNDIFSETTLIKVLESILKYGNVKSKNILGIDTTLKDTSTTDVDLDQYKDHDRPVFTNSYKFMCEEIVSPWHNVLFPFNTEFYKNPFPQIDNEKFSHYNLVASGFFWTWLLRCNNWQGNEIVTLFDISGANLTFQRNLLQHWSPWLQTYSEFALENDYARSQLEKSGLLIVKNKEINIEESKKVLDNLWAQEIKKWDVFEGDGNKTFNELFHIMKKHERLNKINFVNINLISDHALIKKWVSALTGPTFWFVSNIFTSHISRAWANGSRSEEFVRQQRVLSFLNKGDYIFGTLLNDDLTKSKKARII
ncbi:MAG: hypothetical protein CBD31_01535 [Flavobacteriaceae bacterium TMED171]|nr:MAG: hypothetical protein CBD31_01535 [Flavobacteriaceae bacterium TMED171]|tara:strand:- start:543 stop:1694 length:1152 start_codon:yes stop_codon:yes gene_type:complete